MAGVFIAVEQPIAPDIGPATSIVATAIDQDDPTNKKFDPAPPVLFGGSIPSTADNLRLTAAAAKLGDPAVSYAWSVVGRGAANYIPPANSALWDVGDLKPIAGIHVFTCVTKFASGKESTAQYSVEIGIRTDDAILIAWINTEDVPLPADVSPWVTDPFPRNGIVGALSWPDAAGILLDLSKFVENPYPILLGLTLTNNDRHYLLNWLFKFASNPDPKDSFADFLSGIIIDYLRVADFLADAHLYKLFNHFQIKFRVDPNGGAFDLFKGEPTVLHGKTGIGATQEPLFGPGSWGAALGLGKDFPGQAGPNDGAIRSTPSAFALISDGSPDVDGINVFNELMGDSRHAMVVQIFWENIGSRITFTPTSTTPKFVSQPYPTYYQYINGNTFTIQSVQAADPTGNFAPSKALGSAYPYGNNPSNGLGTGYGLLGDVIPGGRNGDGASAPDATSRIPEFVLP